MMPPAVIRGLRLAYGSWKIICIRRRIVRSAPPLRVARSMPSNTIRPPVGSSRRIDRAAGRALAAARLADEPERLAAVKRERDAVHRADVADVALEDQALGDREPDPQVLDLEQAPRRLAVACRGARRGELRRDRGASPAPPGRLPARLPAHIRRRRRPCWSGRARSRAASRRCRPRSRRAAGPRRTRHASGRPASASAAVGGLRHAIRCVASGPVVTTRAPGALPATGSSAGFSVQHDSSRQAQRGRERAADRGATQVRRRPLDREQLVLALVAQARDRVQQPDRVGMRRAGEQVRRRRGLDDEARVHHVDPLGHARDDAEVVGDQDQRRSRPPSSARAAARGPAPGS